METATLTGRVALVAGATRGAGRALAVELARAGAFVYATGRSSRTGGASEIGRPETIEDTLDRMIEGGGSGASVRVDHTQPDEVRALVERIRSDHGRLDVLVNDIFGGDRYADFGAPVWEHDLEGGLRMLRMGIDTHVITSALALPLMLESGGGLLVEMTDGPREVNREYRQGVGFYYDYVKGCIDRLVTSLTAELADEPVTVVGVTPGWLRSEAMLENFGVTEETWTEAAERVPGFGASETPTYVARGVAALAGDADVARHHGSVLTARQLSDTYGVTDVDGSRPDCWGVIRDLGWEDQPLGVVHEYR
ncbi:SDR family oxidoreductase [Janibacter anophelis]|uniref:SDR family oxidoreductase n=1 Tax=Janibacter anophelis TaxID=319054 RepID=UPI003F80FE24